MEKRKYWVELWLWHLYCFASCFRLSASGALSDVNSSGEIRKLIVLCRLKWSASYWKEEEKTNVDQKWGKLEWNYTICKWGFKIKLQPKSQDRLLTIILFLWLYCCLSSFCSSAISYNSFVVSHEQNFLPMTWCADQHNMIHIWSVTGLR